MEEKRTLGTVLRHLLALLDDELESIYSADGLDYRPRFTPVVRALQKTGSGSIKQIAAHAGMTHSAVSQTVAQMTRSGWLVMKRGKDGRERIVTATPKLLGALPRLEQRWHATNAAASALDRELSHSLSTLVAEAIAALEKRSFSERIYDEARP